MEYLELGPLLDEAGLLDDFDCEDIVIVLGDELVASGKASLAQEIPLDILGDGVALEAVVLNYVQILVGWLRRGVRSGWFAEELIAVTIL